MADRIVKIHAEGRAGCGKTTFINWLKRNIPEDWSYRSLGSHTIKIVIKE